MAFLPRKLLDTHSDALIQIAELAGADTWMIFQKFLLAPFLEPIDESLRVIRLFGLAGKGFLNDKALFQLRDQTVRDGLVVLQIKMRREKLEFSHLAELFLPQFILREEKALLRIARASGMDSA